MCRILRLWGSRLSRRESVTILDSEVEYFVLLRASKVVVYCMVSVRTPPPGHREFHNHPHPWEWNEP